MEHDVWLAGSEDSPAVRVAPIEGTGDIARHAKDAHKAPYYAAPLHYGGAVYATGKCRRGAPRERLSQLRGLDLGSEALSALSSSAQMVGPDVAPGAQAVWQGKLKIGVALHLHYRDLWPEFEGYLAGFGSQLRLHVTVTEEDGALADRIRAAFPASEVSVVANLGRDIRPFVEAVRAGVFDDCDLICKLHGKRSALSGKDRWFGHLWRRRCLIDLVGPDQTDHILRLFEDRPEVGMVGSAGLRLKRGVGGRDPGHAASLPHRRALAQAAGLSDVALSEDFFAGTMFWVRRAALEPLRALTIGDGDYTPEGGPLEDGFEHALERFFADCVRGSGMVLEDVEPPSRAKAPLRSKAGRVIAPRSQFLEHSSERRVRWQKRPDFDCTGRRVALLAMRGGDGAIRGQAAQTCETLRGAGWKVVICYGSPNAKAVVGDAALALGDGAISTGLSGFEPALWADGLRHLPGVWEAQRILLCSEAITLRDEPGGLADIGAGPDIWSLTPEKGSGAEAFHRMMAFGPNALSSGALRHRLTTALGWHWEQEAVYRFDLGLREVLRVCPGLSLQLSEEPGLTDDREALVERDRRLLRDYGVIGLYA